MGSFVVTARERVGNECSLEKGIEHSIDRVVEKAIADVGFMNVSGFGIADTEGVVGAVAVCHGTKVLVKREDIVHQIPSEFLDIFLFPLAFDKLLPCIE